MSEVSISVRGLSKKFCRTLRRGMLYTGLDIARELIGARVPADRLRPGEFWAVDDVSFDLRRGEGLSIIGSNGSGKSTILKLLSGILLPDRGAISIAGRVGALIEVGAGFHPMLTGRENILVNGLILGMSRREVRALTGQIIEFAELADFVDMPVKHYSSGMYVRLGFSIAVHAPVEVLLIDEVLAVGDLTFAIKCLRRVTEFREQGGSVVLVTHAMHNVKFATERALWIDGGRVVSLGGSVSIANEYERAMLQRSPAQGQVITYDQDVTVTRFSHPATLSLGETLEVEIGITLRRRVERPIFLLHLHSSLDDTLVFSHYSDLEGCAWDALEGTYTLRCRTSPLWLRRGTYWLSFSISERNLEKHLVWHHKLYEVRLDSAREVFGVLDARPTIEVAEE